MEIINGTISEPRKKLGKDWRKWKRMESDAKYYIAALDEWLMKHIITCNVQRNVREMSREMWEKCPEKC